MITVTPEEIAGHGCTATEGEEYLKAAYECWAEKYAQRLIEAGMDEPVRCTAAEAVYCEYDTDNPGVGGFLRIAVIPESIERFAAFRDQTLGFIGKGYPEECCGWVNCWGQVELTENADGSFSAPFMLDTGA